MGHSICRTLSWDCREHGNGQKNFSKTVKKKSDATISIRISLLILYTLCESCSAAQVTEIELTAYVSIQNNHKAEDRFNKIRFRIYNPGRSRTPYYTSSSSSSSVSLTVVDRHKSDISFDYFAHI